jgi:sec-independent protein translocase protein TatB
MFDFGFSELLVIAVVAILFIGPKELPVIMRQLGRVFRRISYIRYALSSQFEQFMHDSGFEDIKDQVNFEVGDKKGGVSPLEANKAAREIAVSDSAKEADVPKKPAAKKTSAAKPRKPKVKKQVSDE